MKLSIWTLSFIFIGVLSGFTSVYPLFAQSYSLEYQDEAERLARRGHDEWATINWLAALEFEKSRHERSKILSKIGDIFWEWGDAFAAKMFYQSSVSEEENRENLKKLVIAKMELLDDDIDEFLKMLRKYGIIDYETLYHYGRYLARKGQYNAAQSLLIRIPRGTEFFFKGRYVAGTALLGMGDREVALSMFEDATLSPDKDVATLAYLAAARICHDIGLLEKSEEYYRKIPRQSEYYHEALYELVWVLYEEGKLNEAREVLEEFRATKRTYLTRRADTLTAYITMHESEYLAFEDFDNIMKNYEEFLIKLEEIKDIPRRSFWEKGEYALAFVRVEPDIRQWVNNHPKVITVDKLIRELEELSKLLKGALDEVTQIENIAAIYAERVIQKNMDILWWIEERIQLLMIMPIIELMNPYERKLWESALTLRREIKHLDSEARRIRRSAFENSRKIRPQTGESERMRKLYKALVEAGNSASEELRRLEGYKTESMRVVMDITDILHEKYKEALEPYVKRLRKMLEDAERLRGFLEYLYHRINLIIYLRAKEERERIAMIQNEIWRMKERLNLAKIEVAKEVLMVDIPREQKETAALAQMGFIEAAWRLKEKESGILDELWARRKKAQDVVRIKVEDMKKTLKERIKPIEEGIGKSDIESMFSKTNANVSSVEEMIAKYETIESNLTRKLWSAME